MLAYLFAAFMAFYDSFVPSWVPHDAGLYGNGILFFNLGLLDFGPVMFYFIIGLSAVPAFKKSAASTGKRNTYVRLLHRGLAIIGIAAISSFFTTVHLWREDWSHLASIGMTSLLLLPFLNLRTEWRALSSVVILTLYQLFREPLFKFAAGSGATANFGGIAACVGFLGVTLLVTVLADLHEKKFWLYAVATAVLAGGAVLSGNLLQIRFEDYNLSYLLATAATFAVIFAIVSLANKLIQNKPVPILAAIGRSVIFFLVLSVALCGFFAWVFDITKTNFIIALIVSYAVYIGVAALFERFKVTVKI